MHDFYYPVELQKDDNNTFLVTFPDFPEAATFGETKEDALFHAEDCLEEVVSGYMAAKKDIPKPSVAKGRSMVSLTPLAEAKLLIYLSMREKKMTKAELARRLHWKFPQVDRLLKLHHKTEFSSIAAALEVLGKRLVIGIEDTKTA